MRVHLALVAGIFFVVSYGIRLEAAISECGLRDGCACVKVMKANADFLVQKTTDRARWFGSPESGRELVNFAEADTRRAYRACRGFLRPPEGASRPRLSAVGPNFSGLFVDKGAGGTGDRAPLAEEKVFAWVRDVYISVGALPPGTWPVVGDVLKTSSIAKWKLLFKEEARQAIVPSYHEEGPTVYFPHSFVDWKHARGTKAKRHISYIINILTEGTANHLGVLTVNQRRLSQLLPKFREVSDPEEPQLTPAGKMVKGYRIFMLLSLAHEVFHHIQTVKLYERDPVFPMGFTYKAGEREDGWSSENSAVRVEVAFLKFLIANQLVHPVWRDYYQLINSTFLEVSMERGRAELIAAGDRNTFNELYQRFSDGECSAADCSTVLGIYQKMRLDALDRFDEISLANEITMAFRITNAVHNYGQIYTRQLIKRPAPAADLLTKSALWWQGYLSNCLARYRLCGAEPAKGGW